MFLILFTDKCKHCHKKINKIQYKFFTVNLWEHGEATTCYSGSGGEGSASKENTIRGVTKKRKKEEKEKGLKKTDNLQTKLKRRG